MPNALMRNLKKGLCLDRSNRREMIRILVDAIEETGKKVGRKELGEIAKKICDKYPVVC